MACDEIVLIDDGNSAVSCPRPRCSRCFPGTGGLTRLVDKRKVRRDLADVFCTVAEGVKGKRAKQWGWSTRSFPRAARRERSVDKRAEARSADEARRPGRERGSSCSTPLDKKIEETHRVRHVRSRSTRERAATLTVRGPEDAPAEADAAPIRRSVPLGGRCAAFRELDDALLHLRVNEDRSACSCSRPRGEIDRVVAVDEALARRHGRRLVRRRGRLLHRPHAAPARPDRAQFFALIEPGSCFAGTLLELALAADRSYMLDDPDQPVEDRRHGAMNGGAYPDVPRPVASRRALPGEPGASSEELRQASPALRPARGREAGLVTVVADDIDYEDEVRIAIEERASLSPDALTGMEANLRFAGAENCDSKIFGRLSAWQNWIFQRPNAVGEEGR